MAPNDDPRRPEDNPFIAFRRFADSQVSSLLNTVFTLPATIANFNNAHIAREQCLFGRADKKQCERLAQLEAQVADLRSEGRELYQVGDLQAMVKKGEELMQLDRQAEELRKRIVETAQSRNEEVRTTPSLDDVYSALLRGESTTNDEKRRQRNLVEKVANEKGQHWGWMWDWGFPRPFDADESAEDRAEDRVGRWRPGREEMIRRHAEKEARLHAQWKGLKKAIDEEEPRAEESKPKVYHWSFSWPPPANDSRDNTHADAQKVQAQVQGIINEIGSAIARQVPRIFDSPWYSPESLEELEDMKRSGVNWRDAFEDLIRAENGAPLIPRDALGVQKNRSYDEWARRFRDPATARSEYAQWVAQQCQTPVKVDPPSEEPSYEYSHDHEDQHDEPPSPKTEQGPWSKDMPPHELDAYERMLGTYTPGEAAKPSILSTLSTTERTVSPDGTVTTKVVFKKQFADGREESSETVHTSSGREDETSKMEPRPKQEKKKGWFWSM
ncbi:hypothetical protein P280DRAFT_464788 [Massarina eburnea CBS 473.64]|uniref:Uncharacterized protein n=1 Tax=Massarina eburnea CBS 473.64 TaxID=1395130 RepID=A0A6A6SFP0_9PLEO|nr:hypothetical protein P280DRAFT_464788 [Massarina eburnea CBS 473.64]